MAVSCNSRVRVVHISSVHSPLDTRIRVRECGALVQAGYDVTLIACAKGDPGGDEVNVVLIDPPSSRLKRMTVTAWQCLVQAFRSNGDIYHFHDPELAPWMAILRAAGRTVIFDVHENVPSSILDREWVSRSVRPMVAGAARFVLAGLMRRFVTIYAEESYPAVYPWVTSYRIVCNFPDLARFPWALTREKFERFSVVYVGGITRRRGCADMLDAMLELQERGFPIDLHVIGRVDDPALSPLNAYIAKKRLENVVFHGFLPNAAAMELVRKCHVGLAVLHASGNYASSYPTKMFEYMACGLAVIASDFPLYRSVVDEWNCGVSVQPSNPSLIADAIVGMFLDREKTLAMGVNGRLAVEEKFNWKSQAAVLLDLYEQLSGCRN